MMNNKMIIFAQHRQRLTFVDVAVISLALIFTALAGGFSQSTPGVGQLTPNEVITEVEARN